MADSRTTMVDWLRNEFAAEQRDGFPRLKRIPDTRVVRFLDHFASLPSELQTEMVAILAEWSSYKFFPEPLPRATYERFARATAYSDRAQGLRYSNVKLLAGLAKDRVNGGLPGWIQSRSIAGLALQPPGNLVPNVADLVPIEIPKLRKLVRTALAELFAPQATEIGSGYWRYDGDLHGTSLRLHIRFCGKMITPQLHYEVLVRGPGRTIATPNVCFESVLGAGYGSWDYLTEENAQRSTALLCELVEYVATIPGRLPAL